MDIYGWDGAESVLHTYVDAVAHALGVPTEYTCCSVDEPASAYLALAEHLPGRPDREVAVVWHERQGWSVGVESACGEDVLAVAYLGGELAPAPERVVAFVRAVLAGARPGQDGPPRFAHRGDLRRVLGRAVSARRRVGVE